MPLKCLTKAEIEAALLRLSELAAAEGVRLEMTLYGGALMLLAYDARETTKDIDAIIHPPEVGRRLVAKVAQERGLHSEWLNDDVRVFVSTRERKNELTLPNINRAGLHITRPTAKYLLAMKVLAARQPLPGYPGDIGDIETLLRITKVKTVTDVQGIVDAYYPDMELPRPTQRTLLELLTKIHEQATTPPPQPAEERTRGRTSR